jgi:DNA-binding transcriptional regulator LsrR (DeoR family)
MLEPAARERVLDQGTIGEISGALIDVDGRPVTSPLSKRIIGVTAAQLDSIGLVISVAYGEEKAPAVAAALRGGLVNGLVTHSGLAAALLTGDA